MKNDVLKQFISILETKYYISFYLLMLYIILRLKIKILILSNNFFSYLYKCSNIRDLFNDNLVYSSNW